MAPTNDGPKRKRVRRTRGGSAVATSTRQSAESSGALSLVDDDLEQDDEQIAIDDGDVPDDASDAKFTIRCYDADTYGQEEQHI